MMKPLSLLLVLLLAGCGGSDSQPPRNAPVPAPPVEAVVDAYVAAVKHAVSMAPDDTEPVSIDTIATTAPDDSEPEAL